MNTYVYSRASHCHLDVSRVELDPIFSDEEDPVPSHSRTLRIVTIQGQVIDVRLHGFERDAIELQNLAELPLFNEAVVEEERKAAEHDRKIETWLQPDAHSER